jgi:hypothetical protein
MKTTNKIYLCLASAIVVAIIASTAISVPPNEVKNTNAISATTEDCKTCHNVGVTDRHHFFAYIKRYICADCHPAVNKSVLIERNCTNCHNGTAFYANPELNPGEPLHIPVNITVISPSIGEKWPKGTNQTIKWNYTGNPGPNVTINLLKSGILDQTIISSISKGTNRTNGSGSYNWSILPNQIVGNDYQIRINSMLSTTGNIYTNTSDYFSIRKQKK